MNLPCEIIWNVDPILAAPFGIEVRYYGLFWALAFGIGLWIYDKIFKHEGLNKELLDSVFWYAILATIIGARLGHCLFYDPGYYLQHPWSILNIREGGLASHGAAIGLLIGLYLFSRKARLSYIWSLDRIGIVVASGGAAIRIGNLFNSEIYGGPTSLPWGFVFVRNHETMPAHPTQIYEALAYLAIFALLMYLYWKRDTARKHPGVMFGWFLILLFTARFLIEFIKNPQEEFERTMLLDMGQWLSVPFILLGIYILWSACRNRLPRLMTWVNPIPLRKKTKKK